MICLQIGCISLLLMTYKSEFHQKFERGRKLRASAQYANCALARNIANCALAPEAGWDLSEKHPGREQDGEPLAPLSLSYIDR